MKNKNKNRNATATAPAAPVVAEQPQPLENSITPAPAPQKLERIETPIFKVEREVSAIMADVIVTSEGECKAAEGQKLTAAEIGFVIAEEIKVNINKRTVKLASLLRIARGMSEVEIPLRDAHGDVIAGKVRKVPAYDWIKEKLRTNHKTEAAFMGVLQVVPCLDFLDDNEELHAEFTAGKLSAFTVKNALPYLRKIGALPPIDKKTPWSAGALKLKDATGVEPLKLALLAGASQEEWDLAKEQAEAIINPPPAPAPVAPAGDATAPAPAGDAPTEQPQAPTAPAGETPQEPQAPAGAPQEPQAPQAPAPAVPRVSHDARTVKAALASCLTQWDAAILAGQDREAMREECAEVIRAIAKVGGFGDIVRVKE